MIDFFRSEFNMLNVKRRCRLNLNVSDDLYLNNNNNNNENNIKHERVDYAEKLCLQHNKCNCAIPEVCFVATHQICDRDTWFQS